MKRLIAILFVLCAAGFVVGEMMDPDINELEDDGLLRISDVESVDIIMSTPDGELEFEVVGEEYRLTDDGIRTLAKSGRLCEVLGHQWRTPPSSPDGFELAIYVELPAGYEEQVCSICGKRRTRQLTEWKED